MYQRVTCQFPNNILIISRNFLSEKPIAYLVGFLPIRNVLPNLFYDFVWIFSEIVPKVFLHFFSIFM